MCSAWWHRESGGLVLLNKQPFHSLQPNPNASILTACEETFRKGRAQRPAKAWGGGEGEGRYAGGCLKTLGTSLVTG